MIPHVDMSSYDQRGCLHEMFAKQARRTPKKVAVVSDDGNQITFEELDRITDVLAKYLRSFGVRKNEIVGILMDRCIEYVISYIAILKAGGAYLPIEMHYPNSLVESVLQDAQPLVVCSKKAYANRVKKLVLTLNIEEELLTALKEQRHQYSSISLGSVSLDDMAYTVYSSGTTGKPKGIQCPHRGAVFSYTWRHLAYPYNDDEREACNIFFVWEMLRPLLKGIPMYIIPDSVIYDPVKLLNFIRKNKITRMLFTPSLLQTVFETQEASKVIKCFESMRQIWLCGEVVTTTLRNRIVALLPWTKIPNLYSISECHDVCCSDLSEKYDFKRRTYCPVGKLFPMVHALILDENLNEKLPGDAGEIYIGGPCLAIGYLNRPDLDKERFIRAPTHLVKYAGQRFYKTGDWGYVLSDGSLEVIGRCDSMVKIRGYTIELKAVEDALLKLPEISSACALVVGPEGTDKTLVAYVVANDGFNNVNHLRSMLKKQLPFYMIPSQFVFLKKMPLLDVSGKTNKNELLEASKRTFRESDILLNEDLWENKTAFSIAQIWCSVLKLYSVEADDSFFDLGGHSLLAAVTVNRINERFCSNLSTVDLYTNPTIKALARKIDTGENSNMERVDLMKELKKYAIEQIPNANMRTFWTSVKLSRTRLQRGNLLLTGAVGFLGSFIMQKLIADTEMTIYCVVRSSTEETAEERLLNTLKSLKLSSDLLGSRMILITGDISLSKFGLEESEYAALCQDIDLVIHCAANVNLVLPYSALFPPNVVGTSNILSFCLEGKLKPIHYISSNEVFPADGKTYSENADMSSLAAKLDSGYGQTKWLAEQIVISASRNGLPTMISRCGNIGGCRNTGIWNKNDMNLLILQAVLITKKYPDIEWKLEFTPVDFLSKAIVDLTQNLTEHFGKIFHFINGSVIHCKDLWTLLRAQGYEIDVMPYNDWVHTVTKMSASSTELTALAHLLQGRQKNDFLVNLPSFHQKNVDEFLTTHNQAYPQINSTTLERTLQQLSASGYIIAGKNAEVPTTLVIEKRSPQLKGKVALVTGASSGIGYGIAEGLARAGICTVGIARNLDAMVELQKTLKTENIETFNPMRVDITSQKQVFDCVKQIEASLGPIDILINNAGLMEYCKMVNGELDWWLDMVRVNCDGFLHAIAAVLPRMKERPSGHIINITSDAGRKAFSNLAVYSGTKFFEEAVSEAMRQELSALGLGIKVSTIQPGDVESGLHQKSRDQKTKEESAYKIEYLRVEDVVRTVLFVLNQPDNCAVNTVLVEPKFGPI